MRGVGLTYSNFSSGLNLIAAPYLIETTEARDALNVHTDPQGAIRKRNGFVTFSDGTLYDNTRTLGGVHSLYPSNASTKSLIAAGNIEAGSSDSIVKVTTAGVASNLKTGLTANTRWHFAQAELGGGSQGPVFGMNGTDTPQRWDGAAASTSDWTATTGTVPVGKYLTYMASRLWCAGVAATPSRLFYSGITGTSPDTQNWDANNYVDIDPNDGQPITAIGHCGPYLAVFKPRKTYIVYDLVTGAYRQLSHEIGCVAHRSVVDTPDGCLFLSEDQGVCMTNGSSVQTLSNVVQPLWDEAESTPTLMPNAAATYSKNRYYISFSRDGTLNDHTLEYDFNTKSWWLHDCSSNQFALSDPTGTPVLYSAATVTGNNVARIDKAFVSGIFQDNGANFVNTAYYTSAYYVFGIIIRGHVRWAEPHIMTRLRELRVDGIGNWNVQMATNFQDNFASLDGILWDSAGTDSTGTFGGDSTVFGSDDIGNFGLATTAYSNWRYHTPGRVRSVSLSFKNDDPGDFRLNSLTHAVQLGTD